MLLLRKQSARPSTADIQCLLCKAIKQGRAKEKQLDQQPQVNPSSKLDLALVWQPIEFNYAGGLRTCSRLQLPACLTVGRTSQAAAALCFALPAGVSVPGQFQVDEAFNQRSPLTACYRQPVPTLFSDFFRPRQRGPPSRMSHTHGRLRDGVSWPKCINANLDKT